MPTVVLNAYSKAYPSITNRIRASVFTQNNPQSLVSTIIDSTAGHPQRTWSFPGLPRTNYGFSLDEIDGSGNPVNNLALFAVVPGELDGLLTRNDEQIKAGTTPGFNPGGQVYVFDGSETFLGSGIFKPNYIGWDIVPSELNGRGILVEGVDYSWDKDTGTFTLLTVGDLLPPNQWYNIHFQPIQNPAGNSYPTITDFDVFIVTEDTSLESSDFGKKMIAEPEEDYIEVALPDILTVPPGRKLMIEIGNLPSLKCMRIKTSDTLNWIRGEIYIHNNESLSIYRIIRDSGETEWRVDSADGNFKSVGQEVSEDAIQSDVINKKLLNGDSISSSLYSRLYKEYVLNLPNTQVCNYDDWGTGNNKYLYSLANSSNPLNSGMFRIPDRRGLFQKNNQNGKSGDIINQAFPEHDHYSISGGSSVTNNQPIDNSHPYVAQQNETGGIGDFKYTIVGTSNLPNIGKTSKYGSGSELYPKHYLINKYVLI